MTEQELARLVGKYRANVYRLALCYMKNHADAEVVSQEAFLKLFRSGNSFLIDEEAKIYKVGIGCVAAARACPL